jgi:23S rRNA pseudouridine2605 synthase
MVRRKASRKKRPGVGSGRGKPKISKRAKRVAHGFVAASNSADTSVAADRGGIEDVSDQGVRLNRWLAEQGVDSRRKCDEKIFAGEVMVNGSIVDKPGYRVQREDEISVNGARIRVSRRLYYIFYKPRGVLCTNDPRETRTRLCDLVDPMVPSRVYPIGRLDEDSEGLILLTNDGDFSNLIAHPSFGVQKTYVCQINSSIAGEDLERLKGGAWVDGAKVIPKSVRVIRKLPKSTMIEISIREGRNREIRRLLARFGFGVQRLKRVRIGSLSVKGVKKGMLRPLSRIERDALVEDARSENEDESLLPEPQYAPKRPSKAPRNPHPGAPERFQTKPKSNKNSFKRIPKKTSKKSSSKKGSAPFA